MSIDGVLWALVVIFPAVELAMSVGRRSRAGVARRADQGSMFLLWFVISASVATAIASQWIFSPRLPGPRWLLRDLSLGLFCCGLALRWVAIWTLGRFFTVDVAIHDGHALVDGGVYRYIRHPSYTGLLMAFAGVGVFFGNGISLLALTLPIGVAVLSRIRTEEAALLEGLGAPYADYCSRTKRLVPGVY